jgi:hypothetical protein
MRPLQKPRRHDYPKDRKSASEQPSDPAMPAKTTKATKTTKTAAKKAGRAKSRPAATRKLNARQERFCELVAAGESQTDAWLKAGYKVTRDVARRNAAESMTNPVIAQRVAALRAPQTAAIMLTKARKHELLREIAEMKDAPLRTRIMAIAEDSKMQGHYEPEHHVVDAGPNTLASIKERAAKVASALSSTPILAKK